MFNFLFNNFAPAELSDKSILCFHDIDTPYGKGSHFFIFINLRCFIVCFNLIQLLSE